MCKFANLKLILLYITSKHKQLNSDILEGVKANSVLHSLIVKLKLHKYDCVFVAFPCVFRGTGLF